MNLLLTMQAMVLEEERKNLSFQIQYNTRLKRAYHFVKVALLFQCEHLSNIDEEFCHRFS